MLSPALVAIVVAVWSLSSAGCGEKKSETTTPAAVEKRIQSNTNMTPEAQQASLQNMRTRQQAGRIRGQVMHRTLEGAH